MNPLNDPTIVYLRTMLAVRIDRLRNSEERSAGVSAIEWAIITGMLAVIALAVYGIISVAIKNKANSVTNQGDYGGAGGSGGGGK
jgi:Flp pilus assembly pilin Flp